MRRRTRSSTSDDKGPILEQTAPLARSVRQRGCLFCPVQSDLVLGLLACEHYTVAENFKVDEALVHVDNPTADIDRVDALNHSRTDGRTVSIR